MDHTILPKKPCRTYSESLFPQYLFNTLICYDYRARKGAGGGGETTSGRRLVGPDDRMLTIVHKLYCDHMAGTEATYMFPSRHPYKRYMELHWAFAIRANVGSDMSIPCLSSVVPISFVKPGYVSNRRLIINSVFFFEFGLKMRGSYLISRPSIDSFSLKKRREDCSFRSIHYLIIRY